MLAIVVSRADSASEHIAEHLLELADWTERTDPDTSFRMRNEVSGSNAIQGRTMFIKYCVTCGTPIHRAMFVGDRFELPRSIIVRP